MFNLCKSCYQAVLMKQRVNDLNQQCAICDALRDLVPFVQFKKREKHSWSSVNFSKVAGFRKNKKE